MPRINPDHTRELFEIVNISPYPSHMAMKLASIDFDMATLELKINPCHLQAYGIVHGGVLATLIDTATFWSVYMRIPQDSGLVNIDLKLNYLKPVVDGVLRAEGRAIRSGNTISYAEASVFNGHGSMVAHGTSTLMTLQGKGLKTKTPKFME